MKIFDHKVLSLGVEDLNEQGVLLNESAQQGREGISAYSAQLESGLFVAAYVLKRENKANQFCLSHLK